MIEAALVLFLKADTGIAALVGPRVYPQKAPQGKGTDDTTFPRLTYECGGGDPVRSNDGKSGLAQATFLLHCWGQGDNCYLDAKRLAQAVRVATGGSQATPKTGYEALDGFRGTMAGVPVQGVFLSRDQDEYEPPIHDGEQGVTRVTIPATIWFDETA